jgi:hypothetical protein
MRKLDLILVPLLGYSLERHLEMVKDVDEIAYFRSEIMISKRNSRGSDALPP